MKRHNLTEASIIPCYFTWSIISFLLILSVFSCACRNKTNSVQLGTVDSSAIASTQEQAVGEVYTAQNILIDRYSEIIQAVRAQPGFSHFSEFLERGKYMDVFARLDKLDYYLLVPSDEELQKLDNATFTQLIYAEIQNKSNLEFLFSHLAFSLQDQSVKEGIRTMSGKTVKIDENTKTIIIDGKQFPVIDEAKLPPSIRIFFIDNYLN